MGKGNTGEVEILHQDAEGLPDKKLSKPINKISDETMRLMYRLRESESELKRQNFKLNQALSRAEDAIRLYESTPAGNFTISKKGEIIKSNICGSQMLGKNQLNLINSRFGFFVSEDTRPMFNQFLEKVFDTKGKESCKVTLSVNDDSPLYVRLIGIASENGEECLINMVDITERKQVELELARQIEEKEKLIAELVIADKEKAKLVAELINANKEKAKRVAELVVANKEKAKRVAELVVANKEKEERAAELIIANKEKAKRVVEIILANKEKAKLIEELIDAKKELAYQKKSKNVLKISA